MLLYILKYKIINIFKLFLNISEIHLNNNKSLTLKKVIC